MLRRKLVAILVITISGAATIVHAVERGRGAEGRTNSHSSPGGSWSERTHHGGEGHSNYDQAHPSQKKSNNAEASDYKQTAVTPSNTAPTTANSSTKKSPPNNSGGKDAAAGAAAANRRGPQYSGAEGAAAGAAMANRRAPQFSGAQGAATGAAIANRNQPAASGTQGVVAGATAASQNTQQANAPPSAVTGPVASTQNAPTDNDATDSSAGSTAVKNAFKNYSLYNSQWAAAHSEAWAGVNGNAAWAPTNWQAVSTYLGANTPPVFYDYGENITCQDGKVVMAGNVLGTAEEFSQQAAEIAQAGAAEPPADDQWFPLGVFAMVRNEQQHPQLILQFAIDKHGVLRGNFTDELTEHTQVVRGGYNATTQRACWVVGDHKAAVMEAGLANLAEGDAPALIHKNGTSDHWLLVRLKSPAGSGASESP